MAPRGWAETGLEVARRVELLAEMFAERRVGEAHKLPLLLALEALKALLKIRMAATGCAPPCPRCPVFSIACSCRDVPLWPCGVDSTCFAERLRARLQ